MYTLLMTAVLLFYIKIKKKTIKKKQNNTNPLHGINPHQRLARIASLHVPINRALRHPLFIIRGKMLYLLFLFLKEKNNLNVVYKSSIFYPQIFVKENKLALKMTIMPYELCFETLLHVFKRNKNH